MLDFVGSLRPEVGLADAFEMLPPDRPIDPLWRTIVRLRDPRRNPQTWTGTDEKLTPFVVGAYGHSRTDSLVRGVGEGVERFSLIDSEQGTVGPARTGRQDALAAEGALDVVALGLAAPDAAHEELRWVPAHYDDTPCLIPAALVDYPYDHHDAPWFDSGPSGAASGRGLEAATRSALLELIERDAFMLAWDCGIGLGLVDPREVCEAEPDNAHDRAARQALGHILSSCEALGLELRLAAIPTGIEEVACIAGFLSDPARGDTPLVTVGCNAHDSLVVAALGAAQETLQLRSVVYNLLTESDTSAPRPDEVIDENDRLRLLASPHGAQQILAWMDTFVPAPPPRTTSMSVDDLTAAVRADGGHLVQIDMTSRLPAELCRQGWSAVKLIPVGYQALRMDERFAWSWNATRRSKIVARALGLGLTVGRPDGGGPPHPLP